MVIRRGEMKTEGRENMRGGTGTVEVTNLVAPADLHHARLLADLVVPPGAGIGEHAHDAETEYFIIYDGRGIVVDNGVEREVAVGDVVVTGFGARHSIRNTSERPLRLIALIITH